jgi:hypothetical protein
MDKEEPISIYFDKNITFEDMVIFFLYMNFRYQELGVKTDSSKLDDWVANSVPDNCSNSESGSVTIFILVTSLICNPFPPSS